jgi:hypothetical protein
MWDGERHVACGRRLVRDGGKRRWWRRDGGMGIAEGETPKKAEKTGRGAYGGTAAGDEYRYRAL